MTIKPKKKPRGRPPYIPNDRDRNRARLLAARDMTRQQIAYRLGICKDILNRHYKKEVDEGREQVDNAVYSNLIRMASTSNNPAACIFYCKTRLGMRETDRLEMEHSGEITHKHATPKIVPLSIEEWEAKFSNKEMLH